MRALRLSGMFMVTAVPMLVMAIAVPRLLTEGAHAASAPTITSITAQCSAGDRICFTVTVSNPAAGSITLMLTAHTPGDSDFVDTGLHTTIDISPDQATYAACFGDVSSVLQGHDYNTLRVEVFSSTVPGLEGTTTKSASFMPCSGPSPSPSPSVSPSPSTSALPSPGTSASPSPSTSASPSPSTSASPSPSTSASPRPSGSGGLGGGGPFAPTGGFDYRFTLLGLLLLLFGTAGFVIANRRARRSATGGRPQNS